MNIAGRYWIGVMPGRTSFGLMGVLRNVVFTNIVIIQINELRFTKDILDPVKLSMSGAKIADLLNLDCAYLYMMGVTRQGKLRTIYSPGVKYEMAAWSAHRTCADGTILPGLLRIAAFNAGSHEIWSKFFLGGDEEWRITEACLAKSLKTWEKTISILKTTLCPPTFWC